MIYLRKSIFIICLLNTLNLHSQVPEYIEPFIAGEYSKDKYEVKLDKEKFSDLVISVRQIKLLKTDKHNPSDFHCRAWMSIVRGKDTLLHRYFGSMEALGGCAGLFMPDSQPIPEFFILSKFGDYDGVIFIIDTTGIVNERMGGSFYISPDKRFLFSNYNSDLPGLTIYDFEMDQLLISGNIKPHLSDWYFWNEQYFAIVSEEVKDDKYKILIFDPDSKDLIDSTIERDFLRPEYKLSHYNDCRHLQNCNCRK